MIPTMLHGAATGACLSAALILLFVDRMPIFAIAPGIAGTALLIDGFRRFILPMWRHP